MAHRQHLPRFRPQLVFVLFALRRVTQLDGPARRHGTRRLFANSNAAVIEGNTSLGPEGAVFAADLLRLVRTVHDVSHHPVHHVGQTTATEIHSWHRAWRLAVPRLRLGHASVWSAHIKAWEIILLLGLSSAIPRAWEPVRLVRPVTEAVAKAVWLLGHAKAAAAKATAETSTEVAREAPESSGIRVAMLLLLVGNVLIVDPRRLHAD
mmetsp:Transcript_72474/g.169782  ORF Transcript_72474/g.169782 Transcript_72474/m.169782 type:complete len:208 (-) Transcript_72474:66-689(-)